ncbi:putative formate acetyltransferase 3 (pyruvate formate lyase 3) [Escherichia coli]|uniref:Putative formate acetyltransferase 3 (Pyruvate formate lyase 3) n=1 Tax=Escherichia coli TaxID=562 RepID=A0A377DJ69_ECOLX|nr:putative formate acetyltransferase 3 (pyruvate formate lyase 3) [Escherichia coli]
MTTLKLDTLSDRIKAHKNALVHIVKPPVCTERAQHYTEMYHNISISRSRYVARWRWRITWRIAPSGSSTMS